MKHINDFRLNENDNLADHHWTYNEVRELVSNVIWSYNDHAYDYMECDRRAEDEIENYLNKK
jgi:hypothetical protein